MAVTIDATAGGADSNSYATLEEATAYFNGLTGVDWNDSGTTDALRKEALVVATRQIDQLKFIGKIYGSRLEGATDFQNLQWPRRPSNSNEFYQTEDRTTGLPLTTNASGSLIVPSVIKRACMEQANYLIGSQSSIGELSDRERLQREGVQSMAVPGLSESYAQMVSGRSALSFLSPMVVRLLATYIKRGGTFYRA